MIIVNKIKCKVCGDVLQSFHVHDFKTCKCFSESNGNKGCFVDGGLQYLRRGGNPDEIEEMSITTEDLTKSK